MSIARKLWLGFGVLILIFLLASLVVFFSERSTEEALDEIVNVEEPTRAASFEMEINTVEISRDVLDYLETGDERFRRRFADDQEDFKQAKTRHDELVDTPTGVEQGEMISSIYERYVALGASLLNARDEQDDFFDRTSRGFEGIDEIADETIETEMDDAVDDTGAAEELGRLADIQYDIAAMNTSLAAYPRDPSDEHRQRVVDGEAEVREGFEAYGNLDLDGEETDRIGALEERFDATMTEVDGLLDAVETLQENQREFAAAQIELDGLLDEEVQPWTAQQLADAEEAANDSIRGVYVTILVLLLAGLFAGVLAASVIGRDILGSVRGLTEGARRIGEGDMDHRIEPYTDDELGSVAVAFNEMLDKRQEANSALLESEERFRGLSDATFEGIAIVEDGKILETNHAFAEMLGYGEAEVVGMAALKVVAPESLEIVTRNMTSGAGETYEAALLKKDGTVFDVEVRGRRSSYQGRTVRMTAIRDVTERKRAEASLREAEARYRTVVEQVPAVTYTQEVSSGLSSSFVSPQIEDLLGYTPEEYASTPSLWLDTVYPDDRERVLAEDARTNETGEPFVQEYRLCARDGRVVWVQDEAVVVRDENGAPLFWQGFMFDVTERKHAEEEVREAEARYRTLVEQLPAVVYTQEIAEPSRTTYMSPQIEAFQGYTPEEILSDPEHWTSTLHPDDHERVLAEDARTNETFEPFVQEYRQFARDGRIVWVRDEAVVVRDEDGEPAFWQGVLSDITERKQVEEELRMAEERFRSAFDEAAIGMAVSNTSGRYLETNGALRDILGYSEEELLTRTFGDITYPEDLDLSLDKVRSLLNGETNSYQLEKRYLHADGHPVWASLNVSSVRDLEGEPLYLLSQVQDITKRKEAEDALRKSEERYRLVAQATKETIWDSDLAADRQTWNGAIEEMLGYRGDIETDTAWWEDHVHPEDRTRIIASIEAVLESGGRMWSDEYRFRRADGEYLTVVDRCFVLRGEDGEPERIIGSMMDISERKRAEEIQAEQVRQAALRTEVSEVLTTGGDLRDILQQCSESLVRHLDAAFARVWTLNKEDNVLELQASAGLYTHTDGPHGRVPVGRFKIGLIAEERRPRLTNDVTEDPRVSDKEWARREGMVSFAGHPLIVEDQLVGVVAMFAREPLEEGTFEALASVTEAIAQGIKRKWTEKELKELNESLERRVVERTVQLEEAMDEVRRSEERYGLVVSASNDGIYDFDAVSGEFYWNDRLYEIVGLSHEEFTPTVESFFTLIHPEDATVMREGLADYFAKADDTSYSQEFRLRHSSGGYRHCVTRGEVQRGPGGEALRLAGSISDITERKAAEEALVKSEERYRSLFRDNPDAVYSLDLGGNFTAANPANERLSGRRIGELLGMNSVGLIVPDKRKSSIKCFLAARRGEPQNFEMAIEHADGHRVEIGMTQLPIFVDGEIVGVYGIAKDITERKRAEEAIRELNESLEQRVEERTETLQNTVAELERLRDDLEEAKVAAESANKAKSEFLANMSHEIRTPMNGVIGMTELLLDTELSDEQREFADTVRSSGENLLHIINDILDFSKIEAGALRLEDINFDLRTEVEQVAYLLAERAHGKGLELFGFVEPGVTTALRGDPFRLRQVLINLIGNAIKFTGEGEVSIRASLDFEDKDSARVRFGITDTGIGLDTEQKERLFQSFSQADASTTRRYGGTGLGLAISKQIVEMMGGEIWVESEPGRGSTFWFTARLKKPEDTQIVLSLRSDLRGLRVLVVDDNETNRSILQKQVTSWGMRHAEAEGGPQALVMLHGALRAGEPYDLTILDMRMPDMDGMEVASLIKGDPEISSTRLVMLTSMGQRGDGAKAHSVGISAYLTKPVRQSELYNCLVTVMGSTLAGSPAPESSSMPLITRHDLREVAHRGRSRLLVAEDNPVNQKVAMRMLEKLGYRADLARNGLEALEALSNNHYDAVLMDCQMPEMDGYEATAEIRRRERDANGAPRSRVPVIAMTANALAGDREKALEAGMDDHIAKPVKPADLAALLERWIPDTEPDTAVDAPPAPEPGELEAPAEEEPLDRSVVAELRELGGDEGSSLIVDLIDIFLGDVPPRLAGLHSAARSNDAAGVERVAHTLKGSAGSIGAAPMSRAADDLQTLGASGDLSGVEDGLARLEAEWEKAKAALEALKASETVAT